MGVQRDDSSKLDEFGDMPRSGVRRGARDPFGYELLVLPVDVQDAVRSAGGWLCDRVRAGWKVSVFVSEGEDVRPLQILGMNLVAVDECAVVLKQSQMAAVALAADAVAQDVALLKFIHRALDRNAIELTIWGDRIPVILQGRLDPVENRMSCAAAAFKKHAVSSSTPSDGLGPRSERFHSSGLWYPSDGSDLVPVT